MKRVLVTFDHFLDLHDKDINFRKEAKVLAARIYGDRIRATMRFNKKEMEEIEKLLALAADKHTPPAISHQTGVAKPKRRRSNGC